MFVADPSTGKREESAQLVVHVNVAGKTVDIPMRYRATAAQPEREFWVAKWVVAPNTPIGIIRYTVTATDKYGRTGEFKPFEVQASQLTIVEGNTLRPRSGPPVRSPSSWLRPSRA